MKPRSPFQYTRWEDDDDHLIWLPNEFSDWEKKRCIYLTGSRGTGKTTLLKGFEWKQRIKNKSLRRQIGSNPFSKKYIGIYLSMPNYFTKHFQNWPPKRNLSDEQWEEEQGRAFAYYVEYQSLQLLIVALLGMRGRGYLDFTLKEEEIVARSILAERSEIREFIEETELFGLNELRLAFKKMHEKIRYLAIANESPIFLPPLQMGKMLEEISKILLNLCEEKKIIHETDLINDPTWSLKVCFDQAESSDPIQQKALNTMIARQELGVVSFAVASTIDNFDFDSSFIKNHPLTDADRQHINLDILYGIRKRFHEFVSEVTKLRFEKFLDIEIDNIDLKKLLGMWDINALLDPIIRKTENKELYDLYLEAKSLTNLEFFDFKRSFIPYEQISDSEFDEETISSKDIPPIYQTYLMKKLNLDFPHKVSTKFNVKSQKSREIRKKMVAALVCLCSEYNLQVPYGGYWMIMSMSDSSVRDYLRQMHEIFVRAVSNPDNKSTKKFLRNSVHINHQKEGILSASQKKFEGISSEVGNKPSEIKKFVRTLGEIQKNIQSAYYDMSTFKTIERGIFVFDLDLIENISVKKRLLNIIKESKDSHYIKVKKVPGDNKIYITLHKLFAPYFSFSYRGGISEVIIDTALLANMIFSNSDEEFKKIKKLIVQNIVNQTSIKNASLDQWVVDDE